PDRHAPDRHAPDGPAPDDEPAADRPVPALLTREWIAAPRTPASGPARRPLGVLLVGAADTLEYAEAAAHADGADKGGWVLVREDSVHPRLGPDEYGIDLADHAAAQGLAEQLYERYGRLDAVVDLVDLTSRTPRPDGPPLPGEAARIGLLQHLVRRATAAGDDLTVLQVTRGRHALRNPVPTARGAAMAGLVRAVGAEYRAVRSASVDLDPACTGPEQVLEAVRAELSAAGPAPGEVVLRGGDRFVPGPLRRRPRPAAEPARPALDPDRTYLVTGGTSGLGLAAAERLAALGARRLALLGRRPLPPRASWPAPADGTPGAAPDPDARTAELARTVTRLEAGGVRVALHTGPLTDRAALTGFLDRVRDELGPVAGVLHCAGAVHRRRPAFVRRTVEDVAATWEPKVAGLRVLDELVRTDRPDFVVLYSSVSARLPELAVGLGDYAAANAHLDAFAAERNAAAGPDGTRYLPVAWGSWTGLGMGEVTAEAYRARGFGALAREDGLDLLERVLLEQTAAGRPEDERVTDAVAAAVRPRSFPEEPAPGTGPDAGRPYAGAALQGAPQPGAHPGPGTTPGTTPGNPPDPGTAPDALRDDPEQKEQKVTTGDGAERAGTGTAVEGFLLDLMAQELMLPRASVDADDAFADLGVDSILLAGMVGRLEELTDAPVDPSVVLENPTARRLAAHLTAAFPDGVAAWAVRNAGSPAGTGTDNGADPHAAGGQPAADTGAGAGTDDGAAARAGTGAAEPGTDAGTDATATTVAQAGPQPGGAATPGGTARPDGPRPLAVIGMASRFPGAPGTDAFWRLLSEGRSAVREVPRSRWDSSALYDAAKRPGRSVSRWGAFLDGIEDFDPEPFGIAPEDAAHVDPLIRLVLECAEQTFRDAGYAREELAGTRTAVFAAAHTGAYAARIRTPHRNTVTGLNQNFAAAQLAQVYDLRGPHLVVDTACSSSLAALSLAEQALRLGECDTALVAAADLLLDEMPYLKLSASGALSPDGACRVFDVGANGLVLGEGAGALLLKPLETALADGDRVYAVLESVAVNNDGRTMGLTTPNPDAQEEVVRRALELAGVRPREIGCVEAHGTGTLIGDPMELRALTRAFGGADGAGDRGWCAVGSVKSNIGHALMAAGMAGLQKTVLALRHGALPPTLHCDTPNPRFSFAESPFFPNTALRDWRPETGLRRAGVSAFGFGGVNCHAILREPTGAELAARTGERPSLPPAVFHRTRHWVDRPDAAAAAEPAPGAGAAPPGIPAAAAVPAAEPAPRPVTAAPTAGSRPILSLEELN
ncbi:beta-ketoacyl synthase N-terminal-like domain-containing protein, partial [Streptomyces sp. JJ36]|uniref:beta-ketoacyl synthase N-terminal-like domain-containing protein n=1 Tax=Streptomyces sp. JJ36 TaxID=2736645 RepID=UPI001F24D059